MAALRALDRWAEDVAATPAAGPAADDGGRARLRLVAGAVRVRVRRALAADGGEEEPAAAAVAGWRRDAADVEAWLQKIIGDL